MKLHEAIGLEIERRENMSEVKIGADDLRKICRNATNPLATIELCLEWADKAEKIALAMQAEVEEQARLLGASGSREAELLARVEALESQNKQLLERRDTEYLRMLEWRGIDGIENACERCGGSGTAVYGSTSTWRGGAGGQMITSDICDRCWGSGDKSNKWTNLRRLPRLQPPEREGE